MQAYLVDAVRTPRGRARADGGLAAARPQDLVGALAQAISNRTEFADPDALVLGCVGQVEAQGGHLALVSKLCAGLPDSASALTLNNYCVSGLTAIGHAALMTASGAADRALAGGVEMMSRVPFMADRADFYGDASVPVHARYVEVALAADRLAGRRSVDRALMDEAALRSQERTARAEGSPLVASRISFGSLDREECAREISRDRLAALKPAFGALSETYREALGGEVVTPRLTLAHAPPLADGAGLAAVVGRSGAKGARARILAYADCGGDPEDSLTAGFSAMDIALERAGLALSDMDRIEFMEAFAVTIALFLRDREVDPERVNVSGGHLAKGHPMGATGAILLSSLLDALDASGGTYGLVAASGAQGVGAAMVVERLAAGPGRAAAQPA